MVNLKLSWRINPMWQPFELILRRLDARRYQENVRRSLALYLRGEVRRDGLTVKTLCHRLEIRWRARDIHPWDRDLVSARGRRPLFLEQTLKDAEAAIFRLFNALPAIDVVDIAILDHTSEQVIIAGTVARSTLDQGRGLLSVRMRVRELGITYFMDPPMPATVRPRSHTGTLA
jgi:hypothetical protein